MHSKKGNASETQSIQSQFENLHGKYNKNDFDGRLSLRCWLYLGGAFMLTIAGIVISVTTKNYYYLILFGVAVAYCIWQFATLHLAMKKSEIAYAEMICLGSKRSHIGYGITNSRIYRFKITNLSVPDECVLLTKTVSENDSENANDKIDLQFAYDFKWRSLSKKTRDATMKYVEGQPCVAMFHFRHSGPVVFNNASLISVLPVDVDQISPEAKQYIRDLHDVSCFDEK